MIFSRKKSGHHLDLLINNQSIKGKPTTKFIENKFNWKTHISYVSRDIYFGIISIFLWVGLSLFNIWTISSYIRFCQAQLPFMWSPHKYTHPFAFVIS